LCLILQLKIVDEEANQKEEKKVSDIFGFIMSVASTLRGIVLLF
jgi:hypothetical protein